VSPYAGALALLVLARSVSQDPLTLLAIAHVETRGRSLVVHEANGSCSVGPMGINVPGCDPDRVAAVLPLAANLRAAAGVLRAGAAWCRAGRSPEVCRRGGAVAMYNAGDKAYAARVRAARRALVVALRKAR